LDTRGSIAPIAKRKASVKVRISPRCRPHIIPAIAVRKTIQLHRSTCVALCGWGGGRESERGKERDRAREKSERERESASERVREHRLGVEQLQTVPRRQQLVEG